MTSVLCEEETNVVRSKEKACDRKVISNDTIARDESRSFLNFSRENLSISHSDIEQGFNKSRFRLQRQTILSLAAIFIALVCVGLEIWKQRCVLKNAREIEDLKRDVESLRHRFLEEDLLDELKAFEEQLYAEEGNSDDDSGETDIDNADYDSNYDDEPTSASHDYSDDYHAIYNARSSELPRSPETAKTTGTTGSSSTASDKDVENVLAVLRKEEAKRGQEFEKNVEHERMLIAEKREEKREHGRRVNNVDKSENVMIQQQAKHKRSVPQDGSIVGSSVRGFPVNSAGYLKNRHNNSGMIAAPGLRLYGDLTGDRTLTTERSRNNVTPVVRRKIITSWDGHPPKKYYAQVRAPTTHALSPSRFSDGFTVEDDRENGDTRDVLRNGEGARFRRKEKLSLTIDERNNRKTQDTRVLAKAQQRRMLRRHLRAPRQVYAVHYGADSSLFSEEDEHTGNGRARHNEGIFKAWRASEWVDDLGMNRHFSLANDGQLTIHESGLYLVYAQIHYLDEHDENGFHVSVNGRSILQCTVYSPGVGHKSRSCFSAQVTLLQAEDRLVLKDIGSARYTLFQRDKSFFGLVKLGDSKHRVQQQQ